MYHGDAQPSLSPLSWNPDEWLYAAEGGKHAIFRYSGTSDINFTGHVLRIAKSDLAIASVDDGEDYIKFCNDAVEQPSSLKFQRDVVRPLLGHHYIDLGRFVHLSTSFCAKLYQHALASGSIPPSRLPSWKCHVAQTGTKRCTNMALLIRDYTCISNSCCHSHHNIISNAQNKTNMDRDNKCDERAKQSTTSSTEGAVISVEIKPKAGYITTSPLVLPNHRCKYSRTRYSLQQELMELGHVRKGWQRRRRLNHKKKGRHDNNDEYEQHEQHQSVSTFTPSQYSPLDLFSHDTKRVQIAITNLTNNMQNNFRAWYNGEQIFGSDINSSSASANECQKVMHDIIFSCNNDGAYEQQSQQAGDQHLVDNDSITTTPLLNIITRIVVKVLHREQALLSNMLAIQQLDIIDGDGAVLIYERLVHLCNGSNLEAEALLDDALLIPGDDFIETGGRTNQQASTKTNIQTWDIITLSPYTFPQCHSLNNLLDEIEQFYTYIRDRQKVEDDGLSSNNLDPLVMNAAHARSIECVNHLSREGCIYLLQNWLLSLVLCDVSFFVTFKHVAASDNQVDHGDDLLQEEYQQYCDRGGIASCSLQDIDDALIFNHSMVVHYEVKVVDCDPKPARKLRGRNEVESKFAQCV